MTMIYLLATAPSQETNSLNDPLISLAFALPVQWKWAELSCLDVCDDVMFISFPVSQSLLKSL